MIWDEVADAMLTKHWLTGRTATVIAEAMGLTKNQVIGRAHRINLPARQSPIRPSGSGVARKPRPSRARNTIAGVKVPERLPGMGQTVGAVLPAMLVQTPKHAAAGRIVECCWPMWGDKERPGPRPKFCCVATLPGKTLCAEHSARAYAKTAPRTGGGILNPAPGSLNART